MNVAVTITGIVSGLSVWLNDTPTSESDVTAPSGLTLTGPGQPRLQLSLVPRNLGTWHLHARVMDMLGCPAETGLVRNVTVTP